VTALMNLGTFWSWQTGSIRITLVDIGADW
jgi:hypothetical protein